jgi:deoxyribonuclease IV
MAEEPQNIVPAYEDEDEYRPEPAVPPGPPAWMDGSTRIGIHTSIAGDIAGALDIAHGLGANALQIFSSSPRMWSRENDSSRIQAADATRFRARRLELGLGPLVIHDNYLINLASPERVLRTRSIQAFHGELVRALALGADFLVAHPGACCGATMPDAIAAIADGLRQAARGLKLDGLRILLENTAGQGSSVGSQFEELRAILNLCRDLPMGVCIDTAHIFAAGHDIRTSQGLDDALKHVDATIGLANVYVIHANDSKTPLASRVDRHHHIGKGHIGLEAFGRVLNHPLLAGRAFILETPIDKPGDDRRNVVALWKLLGKEAPKRQGRRDGFRVRAKARRRVSGRAMEKAHPRERPRKAARANAAAKRAALKSRKRGN